MLILVLGYRYAMAVSYLRLELRRSNGWQTYTDKRLMGIPLYAWLVGGVAFLGCNGAIRRFNAQEDDIKRLQESDAML